MMVLSENFAFSARRFGCFLVNQVNSTETRVTRQRGAEISCQEGHSHQSILIITNQLLNERVHGPAIQQRCSMKGYRGVATGRITRITSNRSSVTSYGFGSDVDLVLASTNVPVHSAECRNDNFVVILTRFGKNSVIRWLKVFRNVLARWA